LAKVTQVSDVAHGPLVLFETDKYSYTCSSDCRTPLEKRDTKEFKNREEEAERIASEIERSEQYKHHISLENGDGDEEDKFSAVKRTNENNATNMQSSGNPGK
jgi:PAB1-binding protein PBP1